MNEQINALISKHNSGYDDLQDVLREIPSEVWDYKPAPDKWSIREIINHITDCEANAFVRIRKIIAESGSAVTPYDQDLWANNLFYSSRSIDSNMELFKNLRLINVALFLDLEDGVWDRFMKHPEYGKMSLMEYVKMTNEHVDTHIRQMRRNLASWYAQT